MPTPESQGRLTPSAQEIATRYLDTCITILNVGVDPKLPDVSLSSVSIPIRGLDPGTIPYQVRQFIDRANLNDQARQETRQFLLGLFQAAVGKHAWHLALNALDQTSPFGISGMNPDKLQEQVESIRDQDLRRTLARKLLDRDDLKTAFGKRKRKGPGLTPLKAFLQETAES